ncbi:MAG: YCF48-related protein [Colwellia sp.]|nr:YCF48-related protein [Colwellia sp.]MCW8865030.1 YCF48-related protein [Colwellia sp.]MCW9080478.1 YCF48-related protein [Colwellia sp.]
MRSIITKILIQTSQYSGKPIRRTFREQKRKSLLTVMALIIALTGCEASLNLEGIKKESAKPVQRTDQFQAVAISQEVIAVVGFDGLILTSPQHDLNWQRQVLEERPNFVDIDTCPDNSFIALSMEHQVWRSTDQGKNWIKNDIPTQENLISLTCGPDNSYWATGSFSTLMSSKDQGQHWQETTLNEDAFITQIQFLNDNTLLVTGEFGFLARSNDTGQTWTVQDPLPNEFFSQGSYFKDLNTGWVAGLGGVILNTTDGGITWNIQSTPTESPLFGFYTNNDRLFAFGDHGTVLELNGTTWQRVKTKKIPVYLRDGMQISDSQLIVAGGWGALFPINI